MSETADSKDGFHAIVSGPDDGPPIILCHALGASSVMWRELMAPLSLRFRCIAYDASGHGATPARRIAPTIEALANDLAAFMDSLGLASASIVGASIGGMTAAAFASAYPRRVERLVLMATTPKMPDPTMWTDRAAEVRRDGLANVADAAMKRWFTPRFARSNPGRVTETRQDFLVTDIGSYALACEAIAEMDLRQALKGIAAPTLVMAAAEDPSTPVDIAETVRGSISGATSIIVPDAAHLMMIEKPVEIAAWLTVFFGLSDGTAPA